MERLFRPSRRRQQQQQQQQQVDPAVVRKRLGRLCAFLVAVGEHAGLAAAIKEESRGLLDVRGDENEVRYALKQLDRGSILAAKQADPAAFAAQLQQMRACAFEGVALPPSCATTRRCRRRRRHSAAAAVALSLPPPPPRRHRHRLVFPTL
jgi:hypothetical protein